ncbi:MAG: AraC family transcriptional regulator [Solirubrobacteraceae bacterium]|nr:AraC family transcriptional regulator [Solirubrobacteraceae bacterium]
MHVVRGRSEGSSWEVAWRPAHPLLRAHVHRLIGFTETSGGPLRRLELPSGKVALIVGFGGDGWTLEHNGSTSAHHAFVAGVHGTAAYTEQTGTVTGIQADLTPLGAHRLLAMSMRDLAGEVVAFDDLLERDAGARSLPEQLAGAKDWRARLDLADAWLIGRIAAGPEPAPGVEWAVGRLRATRGAVPVRALTEELGWSRRHLAERFREQVGVPPKALGRVLRFEHAIEILGRAGAGDTDLGRVALDCGYYDQSHFNRDFRDFSGMAPRAWLAQRAPDGGIARAVEQEVTSVQDGTARAA